MLGNIFDLLQQVPLPIEDIRAMLQDAHQLHVEGLTSVSGSFKTIYALNREVAVASVKTSNKDMLSKEKQLLAKLAEVGLPAIRYYTDVFELPLNLQAVLLEWVPDSILIDAKDFEFAHRKLMFAALGIDLPVSGEAWALHKNTIDKTITKLFTDNPDLFCHVNMFAQNLHCSLLEIVHNLESNKMRIADLQLLVTKDAKVSIIDPIDVVVVTSRSSNISVYKSLLDDSVQDDPDFIRQLRMGQDMLNSCIQWCAEVAKLHSNADIQKYILAQPKPPVAHGNVHKSMLTKSFLAKQYRSSPLDDASASSLLNMRRPQTRSMLSLSQSAVACSSSAVATRASPPTSPTKRKSPVTSPANSPHGSPTKKVKPPVLDENDTVVVLPESPSKVVAFQFSQIQLSMTSRRTSRKLSFSQEHLEVVLQDLPKSEQELKTKFEF